MVLCRLTPTEAQFNLSYLLKIFIAFIGDFFFLSDLLNHFSNSPNFFQFYILFCCISFNCSIK